MLKLASILVGLLCASASLSKTLPAHRAIISRASTTIVHEPSNGIAPPAASLTYECVEGGGINLKLEAGTGHQGRVVIVAPAVADDFNLNTLPQIADRCRARADFPTTAGETPLLSIGDLAADAPNFKPCGREHDITSGTYTWTFTVVQFFAANAVERDFRKHIKVECKATVPAPAISEVDGGSVDIVDESSVSADVPVVFSISKEDPVVNGKWKFTITPSSQAALARQKYQIQSCTASTSSLVVGSGDLVNPLIEDRCVKDQGTTVDLTDYPDSQSLSVSVFRFINNPDGKVKLSCLIRLCSAADCEKVAPWNSAGTCLFGARGVDDGRLRRSAGDVYLAIEN